MDATVPSIAIRPASSDDVPLLQALVCELADYEKLRHAVVATEADIRRVLFGPQPTCEAVLASLDGETVGFALYFHNYSTFVGRLGIYLEDLFVRPTARGRGVGKALFAHVARIAVDRGCGRMEWTVLAWNEPAIKFYETLGAQKMDDWRLFRLTEDALDRAAVTPEAR